MKTHERFTLADISTPKVLPKEETGCIPDSELDGSRLHLNDSLTGLVRKLFPFARGPEEWAGSPVDVGQDTANSAEFGEVACDIYEAQVKFSNRNATVGLCRTSGE